MKKFQRFTVLMLVIAMVITFTGCGNDKSSDSGEKEANSKKMEFSELKEEARGTTVTFYGYGGFDGTNDYIDHYVAPLVKKKYGIRLKRTGMDIDEILNKMNNSKAAGAKKGDIDIVWINGENFHNARTNDLLYGPFIQNLPNVNKYMDVKSADVINDFGYNTEGYEVPFGKAELVLEYDSDKIKAPDSADKILEMAKNNPGRFTYPAPPDFTGSAFVRNIIYEKVGYENLKDLDPKDKEAVRKAVKPAIDYLNELKPYLWKKGRTYPADSGQMDNMFSDGRIYLSMSYHPSHASSMVEKGVFGKATRTCVFDKGSIGNTHFLAIAKNSGNKAAAMVVINEIVGFNCQLEKYKPSVWGDLPVFDNSRLSDEEKTKLEKVDLGSAALKSKELMEHRKPELPADMIPVIEKIWEEEIPK